MTESFAIRLKTMREGRALSQLALATRAELSQKHVSFLETGRSLPGRSVVLRLAHGLELSPVERDFLLETAGFVPEPHGTAGGTMGGADQGAVERAVARILQAQDPFPGILVDKAQTVLCANRSFDALIRAASPEACLWRRTCGPGPRNLLRLSLHEGGLFPLMTHPEVLVPALLDRVMLEGRGEPELAGLIEEILAWPHIEKISRRMVRPPLGAAAIEERYRFGDGEIGLICLTTSVGAPASPLAERMKLELSHPVDAASEALLLSVTGAFA